MEPNITIYVTKCLQNKYYVGKTRKNVDDRFHEHVRGIGSEWTKMYEPIELLESFQGNDFDEDACTLKYMQKYGVDNVRGGSYSRMKLDPKDIEAIERKFVSAENKCFGCLQEGHFIHECPEKTKSEQYISKLQQSSGATTLRFTQEKNVCYRCGRRNHFASKCFAKTDRNGKWIPAQHESKQQVFLAPAPPKPKPLAILVIDIEFRGPKVIQHGMNALGFYIGDAQTGTKLLKKRLVFDEEKKSYDSQCVTEFWSKLPHVLAAFEKEKQDAKKAMQIFVDDVARFEKDYDLRISSDNSSVDISFVNYYLEHYLDRRPLNYTFTTNVYRAIYDTDCYSRGLLKKQLNQEWLEDKEIIEQYKLDIKSKPDHFPDNDAEYMFELHFKLLKALKE